MCENFEKTNTKIHPERLEQILNDYKSVEDMSVDVDAMLYRIYDVCNSEELSCEEKISQISATVYVALSF